MFIMFCAAVPTSTALASSPSCSRSRAATSWSVRMRISAGGSESSPGENERTSEILAGSRVMKNLWT